ncbi:hypothetical protein IE81DRAFT_206493 [Ceraceosorus guamensis]|uniref:Uncharacterized protein n=1 Tax=Ceraceosorus guamensis TaxID=1522189 RepID=A0A316W7Q8_9BASI|nr:hypothetical protein IE81DRAFT_206493 [Ceraceosorus guamensis]PWN45158.1 hypothetical protein IE81DRAFT_206493 [Ceraceosorus guamensis]
MGPPVRDKWKPEAMRAASYLSWLPNLCAALVRCRRNRNSRPSRYSTVTAGRRPTAVWSSESTTELLTAIEGYPLASPLRVIVAPCLLFSRDKEPQICRHSNRSTTILDS